MSVSNAEVYARRAKGASDPAEAIKNLVKAIEELSSAVKGLEVKVQRLKNR
jgi:hypothetical protein